MKKLNRTREDPDPLPQQQLFSVSRKFLFVSFSFHLTVAPVREKRARQSRRKKNPIGQEIGVTLLPSLPPHRHLASVPATSLPPRHLTTSSPPRCLCATKSSPPHCHLAASVLPCLPPPRHLLATSSQPSRNLLATSHQLNSSPGVSTWDSDGLRWDATHCGASRRGPRVSGVGQRLRGTFSMVERGLDGSFGG